MHVLGDLSVDEFLRDYWQKKPLLIRNAFPDFAPLLSAEELAGLSLENEIESRLILEQGYKGPWELHKGPFIEADFRRLPEDKWTLLIQSVDLWLPEAADLLEQFRFLPSWRIDDLMISYAVDGGSVGPHYDQYDVFLLQAEGQREWRTGQHCDAGSRLVEGTILSILSEFEEQERWVLNPGDMLYLPPGLAHHGIARGECMTYSIGFRAPSVAQLVERSADAILSVVSEHQRFSDADLSASEAGGHISSAAVARLRQVLQQQLNNDALLARVLGELMTEPRVSPEPEEEDAISWNELQEILTDTPYLLRHEQARFACSTLGGELQFFCQGEALCLSETLQPLMEYLFSGRQLNSGKLVALCDQPQAQSLLCDLWSRNLIYAEGDECGSPDY